MMDCRYILDNDLHERYVLSRLEESELAEYEEHIHRCDSCRAELEYQKRLIAALRDIGREEMKEDIRQQVAERTSYRSGINWTKLSKIAAAIAFLVVAPTVIYHMQKGEPPPETALVEGIPGDVPPEAAEPPLILTYRYEGIRPGRAREQKLSVQPDSPSADLRPGEGRIAASRFFSNGNTIQVNFVRVSGETEALPESFDIEIVRRDSAYLELDAMAGRKLYETISVNARIDLLPDGTLHMVLNDSARYVIDLTSEDPRAVPERGSEEIHPREGD